MDTFRFLFILLAAAVASGCSDHSGDSRITSASENSCNVSCGFQYKNNQACLETPVVIDYTTRQLLPALLSALGPILKELPQENCFCSLAVLDDTGKIFSVEIINTTNDSMSDEVRSIILESDAVPIPSGAECLVGIDVPLSFNN